MAIDLTTLTISKAHQELLAREYSVQDLVDAYLAEIEKRDGDIHAYLHLFTDIQEQVAHAQALYDNNEATELTGVPMAVKANIQVEGQVCNASSRILEEYQAVYDATAIRRLREVGVIFLGSTNMDEFAMGGSTENSSFGLTHNPRAEGCVPGGSSGGSAAAVAGNLALVALGTDTGGSIRQPASFTGTVGYKGSYGSVSRYGAAAMGSSLDQIGPIAKTVADAKLVWDCMKGGDEFDMTSIDSSVWNEQAQARGNYRVAVPRAFLEGASESVRKVYDETLEKLRASGCQVEEVDIESLSMALPAYYIIMPAEVSSNLARYDGMRYGYKAPDTKSLIEEYTATRSQGFGSEVKRRIIIGTYVLQAGYAQEYYQKAIALREQIKEELNGLFETYDAIITPTAPTPAFKIGEKSDNPLEMYLSDIYTVGANIAGIPAISVPAGESDDTRPVGVQLIGGYAQDYKLFSLAAQLETLAKENI